MAISMIGKEMLYCPKCGSTYQEGTQRFCTNDGGRLLPSPSANKSAASSKGIFSKLLGRSSSNNENDEKPIQNSRFTTTQSKPEEKPNFQTNFSSKVFKNENTLVKRDEKSIQTTKPVVRLIKQEDVHSGTADVGNRKAHPTGRLALTRQNPKILFGQTIKGRYYITDLLSEDSSSFVYLADDKIIANKQVIFRVLLDEKSEDFLSRILAEERVSLSHINHPNVASVLDSGELVEGKPFVVTEYIDGFSLEEKLGILDNFNPSRTARIIRQVSYALSEVHQNGILHRGLKPSNIFLTISEAGTEQVKVTGFVVANAVKRHDFDSLKYVSPEQLEGRLPNFASDIYSLAVIAFQMLTGRHPFSFTSADQLLKAQKEGPKVGPSNLRLELSPVVDEILEKALAYAPSDRYPKARDFGDALFNALTAPSTFMKPVESEPFSLKKEEPELPVLAPESEPAIEEEKSLFKDKQITFEVKKDLEENLEDADDATVLDSGKSKTGDLAWEKRSPEPIRIASPSKMYLIALGIVLLGLGIWAIWGYFFNHYKNQPEFSNNPVASSKQNTDQAENNDEAANANKTTPAEIESAPPPRTISQPPNTEYFQNTRANLKGDLTKNYRSFSLYYPKTWTKNESDTNFIDVSKKNESGLPMEQFLVTNYDSKGTFNLDKDRFPLMVKESAKKLAKQISNFQLISEGESNVNDWKAYEMKFQGTDAQGKIILWGRCFYMPAARPGVKSGFLITLLATSLSPDIKSIDDVGNKDDLGAILETFEPSSAD